MRNENNSKKAWQEAVERVEEADQSFGIKGSRTSWELCSYIPSFLSKDGNGKGASQNPLGFGVVLARMMDKQCTTNSTWNLGFMLL